MSYDEQDAARDAFYDQISSELYPEHKEQAIEEFTADRLRSFYIQHPTVMRPAVCAVQEAKTLLAASRYSPALVFSASGFELLLKETLLRPVVYGLVHHDGLAQVIVERVLGRETNIDRYKKLLSRLFLSLAQIDLSNIKRDNTRTTLMKEAMELQDKRNLILHEGAQCTRTEAEQAYWVAVAIYEKIVVPMVAALRLTVGDKGIIEPLV